MTTTEGINPSVPPSGTGCAQCLAGDGPGWWFNLRRCTQCGQIGCCDASPSQHASGHAAETGHPFIQTFEPGEDWFWSFPDNDYYEYEGPALAPPLSHPVDQPKPGPADKVPDDWEEQLN